VVALASSRTVREPLDGLLLGIDTDAVERADDAIVRYQRVKDLLAEERIIAGAEIQAVLADMPENASGQTAIFNAMTRHSVVFEPKARRLHVSFRTQQGRPGEYVTLSLGENAP
jgi:hypothetical protein